MQVEHQNQNNHLAYLTIDLAFNVAFACLQNDRLDYSLHGRENQTFDMFIAERDLLNCVATIRKSIKA